MTRKSFSKLATDKRAEGVDHFVVPIYKRLSADLLTPVSAFLALRPESQYSFLLESVEGGEKLARYSFLGRDPFCVLTAAAGGVTFADQSGRYDGLPSTDLFATLQAILDRYEEVKIPDLPRFTCGAVGFMGYDTVRHLERLPTPPPDDLGLPEAVWCFYDAMAAFDHVKHQLVLMAGAFVAPGDVLEEVYTRASGRLRALEEALSRNRLRSPEPVTLTTEHMTSNFARADFEAAVERAKTYIYEGDIFQVVLSQRFEMGFRGDRFNLYRALRQVNPSPYLFYLEFDAFALVGSSPEVLVRMEDGRAEVLPIAGTRPRGRTRDEDRQLESDLLADPKERAEHLMLVDLGRNDLGRVCRDQSISVDRYAFVERYSHVMHIVSAVSGLLSENRRSMDVLGACFPAGTVSGAPKVRAMEIIDEMEPTRRGVYAGAVGYIDFSGNLDTCITIRTMLVRGDTIYVQAGAGIVADSDPTREYEETQNKARALRQAILLAAKGLL